MTDRHERRRTARHHSVDVHRIRSARIRAGGRAAVVDVSAAGILLETSRRLLPGTTVELHMERDNSHHATVRGRVLRCTVSRLSAAGVVYRGAVFFDRHLPWLADDAAEPSSTSEHRPGRPHRTHGPHSLL